MSAEKRWSSYRTYVRDETGVLVGFRDGSARSRYYYLRDALGSIVAVTDAQGAVVRRHVYNDPYGEEVTNEEIVAGAPGNSYRFAGEYRDSETGLYKIGERYYYRRSAAGRRRTRSCRRSRRARRTGTPTSAATQ